MNVTTAWATTAWARAHHGHASDALGLPASCRNDRDGGRDLCDRHGRAGTFGFLVGPCDPRDPVPARFDPDGGSPVRRTLGRARTRALRGRQTRTETFQR